MEFRLAFIGFGVVGQGLAEILLNDANNLKKHYGFNFKVVAVSDKQKGSVYDANGLDIKRLLKLASQDNIEAYPSGIKGWNSIKTITDSNANVIIEVSWTDITTGEPAITHVKTALNGGKNVVMSNKGPIALYSSELLELAKKNNVELRFEGTVMSGTPAINLGQTRLMGSHISAIHGIMNGTTNYILTEMEKGLDYEIALKQAQELGYAEADPTADVEGHDALAKIVILANVVFGKRLDKSQVPCEGITEITQRHIETAKEEGKRWKLIASAKQTDEGAVEAYVKLVKLPLDNPLTSISGTTNAITYSTKYLGDVTIIGPGAGKTATGFALLSDLLDLHRIYSR